jgi:hypothetical protein
LFFIQNHRETWQYGFGNVIPKPSWTDGEKPGGNEAGNEEEEPSSAATQAQYHLACLSVQLVPAGLV